MNDEGTTNPRYEVDSPPSDFNFDTMLPGRVFTMAGEEYLYLEDQGSGNHMIIRHESIRETSFNDQPQVLSNWFSGLDAEVRGMVQPVSIPAVVPSISDVEAAPWVGGIIGEGAPVRWLPAEWEATRFDAVRSDRTAVNSSGTPQAFALSLADVVHLSTETGPFPNHAQRVAARNSWWWLRTPSPNPPIHAWVLSWGTRSGELAGTNFVAVEWDSGGVRPALIINQSN